MKTSTEVRVTVSSNNS